MAERLGAEGAFVLALMPSGAIRSGFTGTPNAAVQLPDLLRQMANDIDRKQGRKPQLIGM